MHCPGSQPVYPGCVQEGWGAMCLLSCGLHVNLGCLWMLKAVTGCCPESRERQQVHCTQWSPRSEGSGTFEVLFALALAGEVSSARKQERVGFNSSLESTGEEGGPATPSQHTQRGWLPRYLQLHVLEIIKKKFFNILNASLKQPKISLQKREDLWISSTQM